MKYVMIKIAKKTIKNKRKKNRIKVRYRLKKISPFSTRMIPQ